MLREVFKMFSGLSIHAFLITLCLITTTKCDRPSEEDNTISVGSGTDFKFETANPTR